MPLLRERHRSIAFLISFWYWSHVGCSPILWYFCLLPRLVEGTCQHRGADRAHMVHESWMYFVWCYCFVRLDITKDCIDRVCSESVTYLCIIDITSQHSINRLLHSSRVLLKLQIVHIPEMSYEIFGILLLTKKVFTIFGL